METSELKIRNHHQKSLGLGALPLAEGEGVRSTLLQGHMNWRKKPCLVHDNHDVSACLTSFGSSDDQVAKDALFLETWDLKLGALPL